MQKNQKNTHPPKKKPKQNKTPFIDKNSSQMRTMAAIFADSLILLHSFLIAVKFVLSPVLRLRTS